MSRTKFTRQFKKVTVFSKKIVAFPLNKLRSLVLCFDPLRLATAVTVSQLIQFFCSPSKRYRFTMDYSFFQQQTTSYPSVYKIQLGMLLLI